MTPLYVLSCHILCYIVTFTFDRRPWAKCAPFWCGHLDPCDDLCTFDLECWWCLNLNRRMIVSWNVDTLSNYLREVNPPLYGMSSATRILNKEICLGLHSGILLMSWWFDDWHCSSPILSLFRDRSCIFSFTHPSVVWRRHVRGGHTCGETHSAPALRCYCSKSDSFLMIFHFPYFLCT